MLRKTIIASIVAISLLFFYPSISSIASPSPEPPPTSESPDPQVLANVNNSILRYQALTQSHFAAMGKKRPADYRSIPPFTSLDEAVSVNIYWRDKAKNARKLHVEWAHEKRRKYLLLVSKCHKAGFPRWYCPDLIRAADRFRRPTWAFDPNLAWIIRHESGFRPCVRNGGVIDCNYKGNRAWGLFQFLGSTWGTVDCSRTPDPYRQTICGFRYIKQRYGTPAGAVSFWKRNGHY